MTPLRAVLTRPNARQRDLASFLRQQGWSVLELPALELKAIPIIETSQCFAPENFDYVMFVSRSAWAFYRQQYRQAWPATTQIAAVGAATAQAITQDLPHSQDILIPTPQDNPDSEGLWRVLQPRLTPESRVLIVAGRDGRTWLRETLADAGVHVEVLCVYERVRLSLTDEARSVLQQWTETDGFVRTGTWLLTSQQSIDALEQSLSDAGWLHKLMIHSVIVIHPRLVTPARRFLSRTQSAPDRPIDVCAPDDQSLQAGFVQCVDHHWFGKEPRCE
ncbi:uroporphyrinogen-III synthase [Orrella sp. 11846]|uniref:uroporphyrinogen-III synthase n=1 Tax=Orrella sp. 11846 TaxID=3409913 RepID=UPI003B5C2FE2